MKNPNSRKAIFSLVSTILLFSISYGEPISVDEIIQCLHTNSNESQPISSTIYTPNNSSFTSILQSYIRNQRFMTPETPKPILIVTAKSKSHVQSTVICAKRYGVQLRIRSGGHDYEGLSYVSNQQFILLDLFNLRSIDIDASNKVAWVQAGASLGEVYYRIAEKSKVLAFPAGVCFTLGAGGHFAGGGYGNMMRKFGLSVDNILDAEIVNVNGTILDRKGMGEDLFWALRGAGTGSFGVILSWKIKLVDVPDTVTYFRIDMTSEEGVTDVVYKWQQVAPTIDNDLFIRLLVQPVNGSGEDGAATMTIKASFIALFLGRSDRLLKLMNKSFPELGLQQKDCIESNWIQSTLLWANFEKTTPPDVMLNRTIASPFLKRKSDYLKKPISKANLELLWKKMIQIEKGGMVWNPYGGRMSEIPEDETPFPHRAGNICKIQYSISWKEGGDIKSINQYINKTRELYEFMTPFVSKSPREAFLNYRDLDIGTNLDGKSDYGTMYFKGNFKKLLDVKSKVDPDNFFQNEQSIPTKQQIKNTY